MVDTIAACATPPGRGGIGIIRISGPTVSHIAKNLIGKLPKPRYAHFCHFLTEQGQAVDHGLALYFPAPNSFTGEDVLELHGHGGMIVMDLLLQRCLQLGARQARPGEFSERAFLNNKIDLAQAEAIADLIDAQSTQAAQSALRSLSGMFSTQIHAIVDQLIRLRTYIEAAMDFPEEEIDFLADDKITQQLTQLINELTTLQQSANQGRLLKEGISIVIAGKPNAGKSSLLNQLSGQPTAIVTDIPGTTRDILREHINLDGLPVHIIDTAGLHQSQDIVEQEGMRRALHEIEHADQVIWVKDITSNDNEVLPSILEQKPTTIVFNKIDLAKQKPCTEQQANTAIIFLSAKTGAGIDLLTSHLKSLVGYHEQEGQFSARRRHLEAMKQSLAFLQQARQQLSTKNAELLAEDLLRAQQELNSITGEFHNDDLLGRIFTSFCIGK